MPVMDGREATKRIKATEQGRDTIVIALTASSFEEQREEIIALGCNDFLRKPFREAILLDLLRVHLGATFIYKDEERKTVTPALTADRLAIVPESLRIALKNAVINLDVHKIDDTIAEIRIHDAEIADLLAPMAAQFQYGEMLAML